jgi:hypothetical protein
MAALDPVVGNALNDVLLANAASGSTNLTIGTVTFVAPYNCRFMATAGTAAANGTAITGTSSVGINGSVANASASVSNVPTKSNTAAISITTTSAAGSPWNGIEIWDSTGTPKRVLFGPTTNLAKTFASGDILSIPIANLTLTTT